MVAESQQAGSPAKYPVGISHVIRPVIISYDMEVDCIEFEQGFQLLEIYFHILLNSDSSAQDIRGGDSITPGEFLNMFEKFINRVVRTAPKSNGGFTPGCSATAHQEQ